MLSDLYFIILYVIKMYVLMQYLLIEMCHLHCSTATSSVAEVNTYSVPYLKHSLTWCKSFSFFWIVSTVLLKYANTTCRLCCDEPRQKAINRSAEREIKSDVSLFGELP